ncbi:Imm52 family immunity protein [Morganella sp. GD04133]|uniref:Imm52 family immunity protein n=1 Tax=Morganella sp. GD04133 TaxID=2975435 RepID=UPI00244D32B8|nr:Imm52 family immunity protein [Morganella sp. GD04133]MDH0353585.1 immunity 52 family protein [Morganella sp. GD04133]
MRLDITVLITEINLDIHSVCKDLLLKMTHMVSVITDSNSKCWFMGGESLSESLKYKAFNEGELSNELIDEFDKSNTIHLWDGNDNDAPESASVTLDYLIYSGEKKITLKVSLDYSGEVKFDYVFSFICEIVEHYNTKLIMVDTNHYKLKRRFVFPDRPSVGWMLFLNKKIDKNIVKDAEDVIYFSNGNKSLIISRKNNYHGDRDSDIKISNLIEISLVEHGALPLYKDLYV